MLSNIWTQFVVEHKVFSKEHTFTHSHLTSLIILIENVYTIERLVLSDDKKH